MHRTPRDYYRPCVWAVRSENNVFQHNIVLYTRNIITYTHTHTARRPFRKKGSTKSINPSADVDAAMTLSGEQNRTNTCKVPTTNILVYIKAYTAETRSIIPIRSSAVEPYVYINYHLGCFLQKHFFFFFNTRTCYT